jgi:hypothetical protein
VYLAGGSRQEADFLFRNAIALDPSDTELVQAHELFKASSLDKQAFTAFLRSNRERSFEDAIRATPSTVKTNPRESVERIFAAA